MVAEHECEAISARTKAALAPATARAVKLGGPRLKQAQRRGIASNKANADRFAANVLAVIEQIKASGATSLRAIAEALGLTYLVMHPGTPTDGNETNGLRRIVRALNKIHAEQKEA